MCFVNVALELHMCWNILDGCCLCQSVNQMLCAVISWGHHHHHHISVMELGHLLTRSDLTYPEVSSKVCHDSFCQLGNSVSFPWVIYYGAFYLHVVSSFSSHEVSWFNIIYWLTAMLYCLVPRCQEVVLLFFIFFNIF